MTKSFESQEKAGHSELPFPFKIYTKYALKRDLSNVCTMNIARDMFLLYLYYICTLHEKVDYLYYIYFIIWSER